MAITALEKFVEAASLEELKAKGTLRVTVEGRVIVLFYHGEQVFAVDNRCPHMGFPLQRGTVEDGILTCHWHHARFDLETGGTFDPWADDVTTYPVEILEGNIFLNPNLPKEDPLPRGRKRLRIGLEQNLPLVTAKAVLGLSNSGADYREPLKVGASFGAVYRQQGWGRGLTILTAMANLLPKLHPNDRPLALFHGLVHTARDCVDEPPRFRLDPLPNRLRRADPKTLKRWFRRFIEVRDPEGAERCLLTSLTNGANSQDVSDMLLAAATDHFFLNGGHTLDFINKGFELLDHIGWEHAKTILPSLVGQLASAERAEETSSWRNPVDLVEILEKVFDRLPETIAERSETPQADSSPWKENNIYPKVFITTLLGESPKTIVGALESALREGISGEQLAGAVTYASALRILQFGTSNEFFDWDTVLHTFTYNHAVHKAMQRAPSIELIRAVFHGSMRVYLDRFLNVPPAHPPESTHGDIDPMEILIALLQTFDQEKQVDEASKLTYQYLRGGGDPEPLLATLGHSLLQEDADFHTIQALEAGFEEFGLLGNGEEGRKVLIAVTRYLAAHTPTHRALPQTFSIARRLHRGDNLFEE
ncbi:Rieske (2Fe-2S) protein [candidate division TA06 bacterium]|nr:Rieske (2Fe-2S) protein [candidate division TA06 bacterium]